MTVQETRINWALLAFPQARDKALAFVNGLNYFVYVFNASDFLAVPRRNMDATTRRPSGWGGDEPRIKDPNAALYEVRTFPGGTTVGPAGLIRNKRRRARIMLEVPPKNTGPVFFSANVAAMPRYIEALSLPTPAATPAPPTAGELQRECFLKMHVTRWDAVKAARNRGLPWSECWSAAAEMLADTSARGGAETMRKSYKQIQRQRRKPG